MLYINDFHELTINGFEVQKISDTHVEGKKGKFVITIVEDEDDEEQVDITAYYDSKEFYGVWTGNVGEMIEEGINDCFDAYDEEDFE